MLERTAVPARPVRKPVPSTGPDRSRPRRAAAAAAVALAWLGVFATVVVALHRGGGAPTSQVLAYLAAWVLGCTFPGVLVWRAVGRPTTIVPELRVWAVPGVGRQLLAWAPATPLPP